MPTATVNVALTATQLTPWTLKFVITVKMPDGTIRPAAGYWVHVYDVDEATGLVKKKDLGTAQADEGGIAVFTNVGGAWYQDYTFFWKWFENRYKVEILDPSGKVLKSFDLWLDHQWPYQEGLGGIMTGVGEAPSISDSQRDWIPKSVDP